MNTINCKSDVSFPEAVQGLMAGDFSRLAPLFQTPSAGSPCPVIQWFDEGLFANEPKALDEAFTCACFNGCAQVVEHFLARGVNPSGGINTGLNAFHWAANRGQLRAVEILIWNKSPLETQNAYGGTVLGCTVWSAIHEPKRITFESSRRCSKPGQKSVRRIIRRVTNVSIRSSDDMERANEPAA